MAADERRWTQIEQSHGFLSACISVYRRQANLVDRMNDRLGGIMTGSRIGLFLCLTAGAWATSLPGPTSVSECTGSLGVIDDPNSCVMNGTNAASSATSVTSPFVS